MFTKFCHKTSEFAETQDLNFFQLKKSWGVSRTFGYVSLSEKRAKKRTSSPGITA